MQAEFRVEPGENGARVDAWLAGKMGIARAETQRLIAAGCVVLHGHRVDKAARTSEGQVFQVSPLPPAIAGPEDSEVPFEIRYEDEHIAVIAKPPGVVVHPGSGTKTRTLVEALSERMTLAPSPTPERPGIVHRLDKDTSGLMLVAKSEQAYVRLVAAMKARLVERNYIGLALGTLRMPTGRIEAPIARSDRNRTRMTVAAEGRDAVTSYRVEESLGQCDLLSLSIQTGRTHQIRVHLAHIGHPIVGDPVYGRATLQLARQIGLARPFLHSASIRFDHPIDGREMSLTEKVPGDLEAALEALRGST